MGQSGRGSGTGQGTGGGSGRGGGRRGRMGGSKAAGPVGICVCPACQHEMKHAAGKPCYEMICPKCGATMARK
jgi:hypothetical protein